MKKIICILLSLMLLTAVCFAQENVTIDFPANLMSEDPSNLPENVTVENGFHNSIWLGKYSTTCTLGHLVTFKFENLALEKYGAVSFGLMSQYADENSTLELKFITDKGSEFTQSLPLTTTKQEFYTVKMPETDEMVVEFDIHVNSKTPDNSMYDIEIEFVKFHKGNSVMLLSTKTPTAIHDGEKLTLQSPAVIRDGSTLTPARFVAESFGAKVDWIAEERKVVITKDDITIELVIDSKTAKVNGKEVELAQPACIIDNYTYTPARFVAENLGCNVGWDAQTKYVFIDR